ncbi:hypothetical protein C8R47DRAFT_1248880 [Mycena vitilis]|nr:hypothetical protein C8R47DRAFT_1248880 [Mycena vitilis]
MAENVFNLRQRTVARPMPPLRPRHNPAQPLFLPGRDSDSDSSDQPSSSPPRLGSGPDFEDLVDFSQLEDDLASGQFTTIPASPAGQRSNAEHAVYTSPEWFPALIEYLLGIADHLARQSAEVPAPLESLRPPPTMSQDDSSCTVALPHDFVLPAPHLRPSWLSADIFPLVDCLLQNPGQTPMLHAAPDSSSTRDFRSQHHLSSLAKLYSIYVLQQIQEPAQVSVESFLTARYQYERYLLSRLPTEGYGAAYVHYARYVILARIAAEVGLHINKPREQGILGSVELSHGAFLAWAGVHSGSFGNDKRLIIRCEQLREDLRVNACSFMGGETLLAHLNALATEPVLPREVHSSEFSQSYEPRSFSGISSDTLLALVLDSGYQRARFPYVRPSADALGATSDIAHPPPDIDFTNVHLLKTSTLHSTLYPWSLIYTSLSLLRFLAIIQIPSNPCNAHHGVRPNDL